MLAPVPLDDWQRDFLSGLCDDYVNIIRKKTEIVGLPVEKLKYYVGMMTSAVEVRNKLHGY
jgi:hypothetical protein